MNETNRAKTIAPFHWRAAPKRKATRQRPEEYDATSRDRYQRLGDHKRPERRMKGNHERHEVWRKRNAVHMPNNRAQIDISLPPSRKASHRLHHFRYNY